MKAEKKNLNYYLKLKYVILLREIDKYDEPMFQAYTRELNPVEIYGVGATPEEALKSFHETKKVIFEYYLNNGLEIPEPEIEDEKLPSGNFIVRTSPQIHKQIIIRAKKDKRSLNSLVNSIFDQYFSIEGFLGVTKNELEKTVSKIFEPQMQKIKYHVIHRTTESKTEKNYTCVNEAA